MKKAEALKKLEAVRVYVQDTFEEPGKTLALDKLNGIEEVIKSGK